MNTGKEFELEVKQQLENEFSRGDYGFNSEQVKIFHQKSYFSKTRNSDIKVDISIEVFKKDAKEPFLIWIYECKDYLRKVPVNDIEEFNSKLEQLQVHKIKATIVCKNGFQEGAIEYAKTRGISLAQFQEHIIVRMTASKKVSSVENGKAVFVFDGYTSTGKQIKSLSEFIRNEINETR